MEASSTRAWQEIRSSVSEIVRAMLPRSIHAHSVRVSEWSDLDRCVRRRASSSRGIGGPADSVLACSEIITAGLSGSPLRPPQMLIGANCRHKSASPLITSSRRTSCPFIRMQLEIGLLVRRPREPHRLSVRGDHISRHAHRDELQRPAQDLDGGGEQAHRSERPSRLATASPFP